MFLVRDALRLACVWLLLSIPVQAAERPAISLPQALQRALAAKDGLNEYIEHNGSALFACPPGVREGGYWGDALFA